MTPAVHHRSVAADFTDRVLGTTDWDAPTPVDGWVARDVVDHLVTWLPELLVSRSLPRLASAPVPDGDPVAVWQAHAAAVQALLESPDAAVDVVDPHLGGRTLGEMVDQIYTADVFMHTWDLARATGQDATLDDETCAALLAGMEQMEDAIRASGQFGARVEVSAGADAQTRMIAFIGRDPEWRPPR
ncbi:maleylpyruvate isomerase N-terminal domain-containing protein [Nocardioides mangrovi]|uniref:Maleylpyruvate isomerase N-terminal domain-containing protein n=1 Tax=Nocardioides mangrovi TaxID=2874580 RepID=A0ABS7UCE8_9ACTN|nr:maleylpyruvate isomerase N-terminal domain-containing protein [Nocardioides mangrovi]MBZ5738524.1 maleylpyruvate isomerase N-terminal domain-containing protein [Nocardioides mangrovi]